MTVTYIWGLDPLAGCVINYLEESLALSVSGFKVCVMPLVDILVQA